MSVDAIQAQVARATSLGSANPRALSQLPAAEQVKAAAGQFEAILVRQFLEESVGKIMGGASGGAGGGSVYSYLLTDTLANQLTQGGGLGLSSVIQHQLTPRPSSAADLAGVANDSAS